MDVNPAVAKGGWSQGSKIAIGSVVIAALLLLAGGGAIVGIGIKEHKDQKHKSKSTNTTAVPGSSQPTPSNPNPPTNATNGTNGTVVETTVYCPMPATKPGENRTQILQPVSIDTSNATAHVNQANKFVSFFLEQAPYSVGIDILIFQVLQEKRNLLVQYLSTCRIDAVANVTGKLPKGPGSLPDALVQRIVQQMAVVLADFGMWLAGSPKEYRTLTPYQVDMLDSFQGELNAFVASSSSEPFFEDPLQQLAFYEARLAQYGIVLGRDTAPSTGQWLQMLAKAGRKQSSRQAAGGRRMKAANATSIRHNLGVASFSRAKIGIVFHAVQYIGNDTSLQPLVAQLDAPARAEELVEAVNGFYELSGANLEFFVKEYRYNVTQYPYLQADNRTVWQKCAADNYGCGCTLAKRHNVEPTKYINVFVMGYYGDKPRPKGVGSTSAMPYVGDFCPGSELVWNQKTVAKMHHIWLAYDVFDANSSWVNARYNEGAATLAHELGHFLGLLHTHREDCISSSDHVPDTPPELNSQEQPWFYDLYRWCGSLMAGEKPATATLKLFNTCPGDKFVDNLFNIMSYTPGSCNLYFTVGQVRRLQTITMREYKDMLVPV